MKNIVIVVLVVALFGVCLPIIATQPQEVAAPAQQQAAQPVAIVVHELPQGMNVVVRQIDAEVHVWVVKEQQPQGGEAPAKAIDPIEQKKLDQIRKLAQPK